VIRASHVRFAAATLLVPLAGCGIFAGSGHGPDQVRELKESIERVSHEAETSQQSAKAAVAALQKFCAANFGKDALAAYADLEHAVADSREQERTLRASVPDMQGAADSLFASWTADLESYSSPELRQQSQERLTSTRARYQAVARAANTALSQYAEVNRRLCDHVLFFGHDLNADALRSITAEVKALSGLTTDLDRKLADCRSTATAYVGASALPSAALAPAAPGVEKKPSPRAK